MHPTSIQIMALVMFTAASVATHPAPQNAPRDEAAATEAGTSAASDKPIRLAQVRRCSSC